MNERATIDAATPRCTARGVKPGQLLSGKYRVEAVLGAGGMGEVLAARHVQLLERVALKIPHAHTLVRGHAVERLLREARVGMRLRGDHVARVYDVATTDDGVPFLVMDLLEGNDLAATIRARGALPVSEAVGLVLQACEGVAEAHASGVVHRDLKPANLFLTTRVDGSPCVKVLDFGVAKVAAGPEHAAHDAMAETASSSLRTCIPSWRKLVQATSEAAPELTSGSSTLGTLHYMAPEQLRCPRDVDARCDVWALGAILHELVRGAPAFEGATRAELEAALLMGAPAPLALPGRAGRALERALAPCLAKDLDARYPDVATFARAIAPFGPHDAWASAARVARIAGRGAAAAAYGAAGGGASPGWQPGAKRALGAIALGLALGAAIMVAMGGPGPILP